MSTTPELQIDTSFMEKGNFTAGKLLEYFEADLRKISDDPEFLKRYVEPLEKQKIDKKKRMDAIYSILGVTPSTTPPPNKFFGNFVIKSELDKKAVQLTIAYPVSYTHLTLPTN